MSTRDRQRADERENRKLHWIGLILSRYSSGCGNRPRLAEHSPEHGQQGGRHAGRSLAIGCACQRGSGRPAVRGARGAVLSGVPQEAVAVAIVFSLANVRLLFAYTKTVPGPRACVVSFTDPEGLTHSVEVVGESLFQAAALAVAEFRRVGSPTPASARPRA